MQQAQQSREELEAKSASQLQSALQQITAAQTQMMEEIESKPSANIQADQTSQLQAEVASLHRSKQELEAEHAAQLQSTQSEQSEQSEQLQRLEVELRRAKAEARANADQLTRAQVRGQLGWLAA